jgi:CBS domain containing-hemolysin-like protein
MEDILEKSSAKSRANSTSTNMVQIQVVSPTTAEVDARVHLDDLNERLHYDLPEDGEFDTIGGFVFSQLGRVPSVGEVVSWKQLRFTVLTANKRTIHRLRIEVQPENIAAEAETNAKT